MSTETSVLSRTVRSMTAHRIPMVVVSSNTILSILSRSSSPHITVRRQAGRLFFITIGEALASLAPSHRSLDIACPSISPEQSSMSHSIFRTESFSGVDTTMALTTPEPSPSRFPAPVPILSMMNPFGAGPVRTAAANAAPVGVTCSPRIDVTVSGRDHLLAISVTAGTGTGIVPCMHLTDPVPSQRSVKRTSSKPRSSMQNARETMSTIESTAPTSWRCTSSTGTPCTRASASDRIARILRAIPFASSASEERAMMPRMSSGVLCAWCGCLSSGASLP